ncbi:unnamed protein product [Owenia fusiformis]|uniref:Uncharacterized protein n=1 Tax=Owenia fusiformis TaxID=6347 RepID=A0A8J1UTZ3_OWEFU|nr:unnamed protein product [Owenia fusiformis]
MADDQKKAVLKELTQRLPKTETHASNDAQKEHANISSTSNSNMKQANTASSSKVRDTNDYEKPLPPVPKNDDDSASSADEEVIAEMLCPRINCPEKIVICLDLSTEMDNMTFRTKSGTAFSPLKLIKRALGIYVNLKSRIDSRHQFALVFLRDQALLMGNLTTDPQRFLELLEGLNTTYEADSFDMTSLFNSVCDRLDLPKIDNVALTPPPYIIRTIFIYGRSHTKPHFTDQQTRRMLQSSPYFFFDAFYIHETPGDDNDCEAIYDYICDLDDKGHSYVFEVSKNPTKLYDCMAQFLAHPLQRPLQKDISYKIEAREK